MAATIKAKTAAKRSAKSAPAAPSPTAIAGLDFEPPRLTTDGPDEPSPRVPLFYIDDTEYSVEARPAVNVALAFMDMFRKQGEYVAIGYLLERLLGADGYRALMNFDRLRPEEFEKICGIAAQLAMGVLEAPKA